MSHDCHLFLTDMMQAFSTLLHIYLLQEFRRLFHLFHRHLFCWADKWAGTTMDEILAIEGDLKTRLDEVMDLDPKGNTHQNLIGLQDPCAYLKITIIANLIIWQI